MNFLPLLAIGLLVLWLLARIFGWVLGAALNLFWIIALVLLVVWVVARI